MNEQRDPETYAIIGAAMKVHAELGRGFLETVYKDALEVEFLAQGIPFEREKRIDVYYAGQHLRSYFIADFICFGAVVVEVKAIQTLTDSDIAQTINYLKATRLEKALLSNFATQNLQYRRLVRTKT